MWLEISSLVTRLATNDGLVARLLRFAVVGGSTSGLYVLVVAVLVELGEIVPGLAAALAYVLLLPISFLGHKHATFRSSWPLWPEVARFLGLHGITALVSVSVMGVAVNGLDLPHWGGSVAISVLAPVINFVLLHFWVFHSSRQGAHISSDSN